MTRGHHDVGGLPGAGKIDQTEHQLSDWEILADAVNQALAEDYPGLTTRTDQAVDVYTTLDLHLQRLAQDAVRSGLMSVDERLSRRKRRGKAEAALMRGKNSTTDRVGYVGAVAA